MYCVDCFETYSPITNMNAIGVVLSKIRGPNGTTNTDNAFLNNELRDRIHMEVSFGITINAAFVVFYKCTRVCTRRSDGHGTRC